MPNLDLKSKDKNTILAALFMTLYALLRIVEFICIVTKWSLWSFLGLTDLLFVCEMISILFLAAILLINDNKKTMIIASSAAALCNIIIVFRYLRNIIRFKYLHFGNELLFYIILTLAYVSLVVIINMCRTNNPIGKKVWFIPFILMLISAVNYAVCYFRFLDTYRIINIVSYLLGSVAFFFAGKKLSQEIVVTEKPSIGSVPKNDPLANKYMQTGNADKLLELKKMFDDGLITEEDFEEKKKQILNI